MNIQYYFISMNVKICIFKKTYTKLRTLTKPANVSSFINGITKLQEENIYL
jgi:hypothetical protein